MAVLALALWDNNVKRVELFRPNAWVNEAFFALCILGFVALVGIGWEWFEFCFDEFIAVRNSWGLTQLGLADTMADLFFDLLGALVVIVWYRV